MDETLVDIGNLLVGGLRPKNATGRTSLPISLRNLTCSSGRPSYLAAHPLKCMPLVEFQAVCLGLVLLSSIVRLLKGEGRAVSGAARVVARAAAAALLCVWRCVSPQQRYWRRLERRLHQRLKDSGLDSADPLVLPQKNSGREMDVQMSPTTRVLTSENGAEQLERRL